MSINIGHPRRSQNEILKPMNYGLSRLAQQRLDQVVTMANARHQESLKVDGAEAYVWVRSYSGHKCTCQETPVNDPVNLRSGTDQNNDDFKVDSDRLSARSELLVDTFDTLPKPRIRTIRKEAEVTSSSELSALIAELNQEASEEGAAYRGLAEQESFDSSVSVQNSLDPEKKALTAQAMGNDFLINGGLKNKCGICFGAGYTNSYDLFNGKRIVLDNSGAVDISANNGFEVLHTHPNSFRSDATVSHYIEWTCVLPKYFLKMIRCTVRNNVDLAANLKVQFSEDGTTWTDLTPANMLDRNGQANTLKIRVSPESAKLGSEFEVIFTHVELIFQFSSMPYVQMPPLVDSENYDYFEPVVSSHATLDSVIPNLQRYSLISDSREHFLWKITDITTAKTRKGQLFSFELDTRLVHRFEQLYLLNIFNDDAVELSYRGLERYQGLLQGTNIKVTL